MHTVNIADVADLNGMLATRLLYPQDRCMFQTHRTGSAASICNKTNRRMIRDGNQTVVGGCMAEKVERTGENELVKFLVLRSREWIQIPDRYWTPQMNVNSHQELGCQSGCTFRVMTF